MSGGWQSALGCLWPSASIFPQLFPFKPTFLRYNHDILYLIQVLPLWECFVLSSCNTSFKSPKLQAMHFSLGNYVWASQNRMEGFSLRVPNETGILSPSWFQESVETTGSQVACHQSIKIVRASALSTYTSFIWSYHNARHGRT